MDIPLFDFDQIGALRDSMRSGVWVSGGAFLFDSGGEDHQQQGRNGSYAFCFLFPFLLLDFKLSLSFRISVVLELAGRGHFPFSDSIPFFLSFFCGLTSFLPQLFGTWNLRDLAQEAMHLIHFQY